MRYFLFAVGLLALLQFCANPASAAVLQKKNKTVDVKVIDHKGINTVITPKHVLDHNNVTEQASNDCPKDEAGRVCSDNGKCDELLVGTEDVDNKLTQKVCYCKPGYYGKACGKVTCNSPCGIHGVCKKDPAGLHPRCYCDKGWGGDGCTEKLCPHSDEELKLECSHHGVCKDLEGKKVCYCEPGYYGDGCQYSYVKLPSPTKEHNISYNPLVPTVDVVDLDVHNSTLNGTEVKLTGCRAEQFSDVGERVESNVCSNHGVCRVSVDPTNPDHTLSSCDCDEGYEGPLCSKKICDYRCAANGGTCDFGTGLCKNCPANRFGSEACQHLYCGRNAGDRLGNKCYNNGACSNVTGKCTCFVDGEVDANRCKDKPNTACSASTCSFGKCVNATHCKCDAGFTGKHCDIRICPEDCNWNELKPQGECFYDEEGAMKTGSCQCYPGWTGDACDRQSMSYEASSACDRDCPNQCLEDFPSRCKFERDFYTTVWDQKSRSTVAKQIPTFTKDRVPTLEQLHINPKNWTRTWKESEQGPENKGIRKARKCYLQCVSECLSECQKELQSKSSLDRANTKMDKFVKDQLEMSGHISKDVETDKRKNATGDLVISNEMAQKVSHKISDQAENEKIVTSDAGSLDQEESTETPGSTNKFKAIGAKLEKAQKKVSSGSGILGWIGGFFGGSKK